VFRNPLAALSIVAGLSFSLVSKAAEPGPSTEAAARDSSAVLLARASFNQGLALAGAKDYRAAIAAFEHAYQLAPHYAVLYNIGRSHAALGENQQAIRFLRRYLKDGRGQIAEDRAAQVEVEIAELLRQSEAETQGEKPPEVPAPVLRVVGVPQGSSILVNGTPWHEGDAVQPGSNDVTVKNEGYQPWSQLVELSSGSTTTVVVTLVPTQAAPESPVSDAPRASNATPDHTLAFVLSGAGLGVAVGAGALWLWNDGRFGDWKKEDADLQQTLASQGSSDDTNRRQNNNNDLLQSVHTVDAIALVAGVVGVGVVGAGVYVYLTDAPSSQASTSGKRRTGTQLRVGAQGVSLAGTW
jgi:tetratricopeptide (TPR) repeat protein